MVLTCYFITLGLIAYSPTYYLIKGILLLAVLGYFLFNFKKKKPCSDSLELIVSQNKWVFVLSDGQLESYDEAKIIIHNPLFQLIKLTSQHKNKLRVLFNDQLTSEQLRLLHLKIATATNV